jgi:hypothetical protein
MARKGNSRIVTMFVEANWVTAFFTGVAEFFLVAMFRGRRMNV